MDKDQDEIQSTEWVNFSHLSDQIKIEFDYEIDGIRFGYPPNSSELQIGYGTKKAPDYLNYNNFKDRLNQTVFTPPPNIKKANCFKRLVSKQKRRFQSARYDLDMAYVTEKVIAMGFPSYTCEKVYRNDITDVRSFFEFYHNSNMKIYNLCLEKERIYNKSLFNAGKVGLFPATDHNPCPIRLILDCCVDICLYLIKNSNGVAAIHCKAGKGRTGVMICSYLIFSNLCKDSAEAIDYYARMRTYNGRGVTIASQKRYIQYFESFLSSNFTKPYMHLLPKIVKDHILNPTDEEVKVKNLLIKLQNDSRYYASGNRFKFNQLKVGYFDKVYNIEVSICDFRREQLSFSQANSRWLAEGNNKWYFLYSLPSKNDVALNSDLKIKLSGKINCYVWVNLWYATLQMIDKELRIIREWPELSESIQHLLSETESETDIPSPKAIKGSPNDEINYYNYQHTDGFLHLHSEENPEEDEAPNEEISIPVQESDNETNKSIKDKITNLIETEIKKDKHKKNTNFVVHIKHDSNLSEIIDKINRIKLKKESDIIYKNKLTIKLSKDELDKFEEKKKMKDVIFELTYSLDKTEPGKPVISTKATKKVDNLPFGLNALISS